jgi:hypothetical protein
LSGITTSHSIRDVEIIPRTTIGGSIGVKYIVTKGNDIISTSDMNAVPNIEPYNIVNPMPWFSKVTYDEGTLSQRAWITGNVMGIWNPTQQQINDVRSLLPDEKPLYKLLTNSRIFWPEPLQQINHIYTHMPNNKKPVKTHFTSQITFLPSAVPAYLATDLTNCTPLNVKLIGQPNSCSHVIPSDLLGWHQNELFGNYCDATVRFVNLDQVKFYYYSRRGPIAKYQVDNASVISNTCSALGGYFALTSIVIDPNYSNEYFQTAPFCSPAVQNFKNNKREYDVQFIQLEHYTNQTVPPESLYMLRP